MSTSQQPITQQVVEPAQELLGNLDLSRFSGCGLGCAVVTLLGLGSIGMGVVWLLATCTAFC